MKELKQNCKWSLVVPTSMGVRITPPNGQPVYSSDTFFMQATSAETNVASIASYLGMPVKVLTTFVKDSPIAQFIKSNLRSRYMEYEGKTTAQGKLAELFLLKILIWIVFSDRKACKFYTCPV